MSENEKMDMELNDEALEQAAGGSFDEMFEDHCCKGYCPNGCRMYAHIDEPCPECGAICIGDPKGIYWKTIEAKKRVRYYPKD